MRKDLPIPQKLVQSCHAVFDITTSKTFKPPHVHPNIILCEIKGERQLFKFAKKLEKAGVRCALFQEPDRDDEYTALATEVVYDSHRSLFKNLQLLGEK